MANTAYQSSPAERWERTREEAKARLAAAAPVAAERLATGNGLVCTAAAAPAWARRSGSSAVIGRRSVHRHRLAPVGEVAAPVRARARMGGRGDRFGSGAMARRAWIFASLEALPTKMERASVLALALASFLVRGGERVALLGGESPPATGRVALRRIAHGLSPMAARESELPPELQEAPFGHRMVVGFPRAVREIEPACVRSPTPARTDFWFR